MGHGSEDDIDEEDYFTEDEIMSEEEAELEKRIEEIELAEEKNTISKELSKEETSPFGNYYQKSSNNSNLTNFTNNMAMSSYPFSPGSSPINTPGSGTFGSGGSYGSFSSFGSGSSSFFGGNSSYSSPQTTSQNQQPTTDRSKQFLFCGLFDTLICSERSWLNNRFIPNQFPSNILEMRYRLDVLEKMRMFTPDYIHILIPEQHIRSMINCGPRDDIETYKRYVSGAIKLHVSTYLRLPSHDICQFSILDDFDYRSVAFEIDRVIKRSGLDKQKSVYIGINSGSAGYSDSDVRVSNLTGIEYLNTNVLLMSI